MRRVGMLLAVALAALGTAMGQSRNFHGTVIRMNMSECTRLHGIVSMMSGTQVVNTQPCPEYTVMTDKIVYVLVGRKPEQFIPLAENVLFHVRRSDVVVISDDEKDEWHFAIRQMKLRQEWERDEQSREAMMRVAERSMKYELHNASRTALIPTDQ